MVALRVRVGLVPVAVESVPVVVVVLLVPAKEIKEAVSPAEYELAAARELVMAARAVGLR